jgi:hypothetical protein
MMPEEERSWLVHSFSPYMRCVMLGIHGPCVLAYRGGTLCACAWTHAW